MVFLCHPRSPLVSADNSAPYIANSEHERARFRPACADEGVKDIEQITLPLGRNKYLRMVC